MQHHEEPHPRSAEPAVNGHPLTRGDGEGYGLCIAVEKIDVARTAGERARRVDAVADVLHAVRRIAGDYLPRRFVVEAKRRNAAVFAVEEPGLAIGRRRGQSAEPAPERKSFAQQSRDRRAKAQLEGAPQVGIREGVDLQHDEPALRRTRPLLAREQTVLCAIVPLEQRPRARARAALLYSRWRSI